MADKGLLIWILGVCLDSAACSSYRATPVRADHVLVSAHSGVYEDYMLCRYTYDWTVDKHCYKHYAFCW